MFHLLSYGSLVVDDVGLARGEQDVPLSPEGTDPNWASGNIGGALLLRELKDVKEHGSTTPSEQLGGNARGSATSSGNLEIFPSKLRRSCTPEYLVLIADILHE